jgi:predicted Zn-dependent peptidase
MELGALDRFIDEINAVTKEQVNTAIGKYLQLDNTVTVVAGTLPKK